MSRFVVRRLVQALLTVFGVMVLTYVLFRMIAGDVSVAYVNQKLGNEARQAFYEKHKLDRPALFNFHRRFEVVDHTTGPAMFEVGDVGSSRIARALHLHIAPDAGEEAELRITSSLVFGLDDDTPLEEMADGALLRDTSDTSAPYLRTVLSNADTILIAVQDVHTCGDLVRAFGEAGGERLTAGATDRTLASVFDSQFFWHLYESITFSGRSYATDQTLLEIVAERARFSLALTIPSMAIGWLVAMVLSMLVAYYRGTSIDHLGVVAAVLGMCVPYLAYMLLGQWIMFRIAPRIAVGLSHPLSIFVPVLISVIAGTGTAVLFYRTIILDEINKDYVRTARAKGVSLPTVLFQHVLRNCMLPILTQVITAIPFLILGSLLLERFFGIPGLGDLMLTSISSRDVPIITGLTFLTSMLYALALLATDILYAVFDPRVRLQ
jgi:peptide/nickel transport system permease protein